MRAAAQLLFLLLGGWAAGSAAQGQAPAETLHTVFTTECTPYFNWQSLGLLYSHRRQERPGSCPHVQSSC